MIFAIAFLDSVIPIVPSETCVIIGGVAASQGNQNIFLVIAFAAVGAFLGDNTAYLIGRRASGWFHRRAERKPKFARKMAWAQMQILERGGLLLITARFIPGGRTILTLSCGITRQNHWWFIRWVALATIIWATYAAMLGFDRRRGVRGRPHQGVPVRVRPRDRDQRRDRGRPPLPQQASRVGVDGGRGIVKRHLAQLNIATLRPSDGRPADRRFRQRAAQRQRRRRAVARVRVAAAIRHRRRHRHPGLRRSADHRQPHGVGVARGAQGIRLSRCPSRLLPPPRRVVRRGIDTDRAVVGAGRRAADHRRRQAAARLHRGVRFVAVRLHDGPDASRHWRSTTSGSTTPSVGAAQPTSTATDSTCDARHASSSPSSTTYRLRAARTESSTTPPPRSDACTSPNRRVGLRVGAAIVAELETVARERTECNDCCWKPGLGNCDALRAVRVPSSALRGPSPRCRRTRCSWRRRSPRSRAV